MSWCVRSSHLKTRENWMYYPQITPMTTRNQQPGTRNSLFTRDIKAGHLRLVANEQSAVGNRRIVPCLAFNRGKPGYLRMLFRGCLHQYEISRIADHNQVPASQNHLPVSIPPALPLLRTGVDINARQNSFVQSIGITLVENRAIELVVHCLGRFLPDLASAQ